MRYTTLCVALLLLLCSCLCGDVLSADQTGDLVVAVIKSADKPADLEDGLSKIKLTPQQLLESKVIWAVIKAQDTTYYATLKPDIDKALPTWQPSEALLYKHPSELEATEHFMAALAADADSKADVAKTEILAAIWEDPTQQVYTKEVQKLNPPPSPKIPMDLALDTVDGKKATLAQFVKGNKALYIQIWATWCGPCLHLLPALQARFQNLPAQGVAVVAMNSQLGQGGLAGGDLAQAKEVVMQKKLGVPCLVEPADGTYTQLLGIDSVPRALLVDAGGNILFNGHPMDSGLVTALKKLDVKIDLNAGLADK
jgi:thiol-disulfide isomerase/thioredoxin